MRTLRTVLSALPLLLAGCGDLFFVEADAPEVCSSQLSDTFPGTLLLGGLRFDPPPITFPLDLAEVADLLPDSDVEGRVRLAFIELTSTTLELGAIETATARVRPQGSTNPALELDLSYTRPAGAADLGNVLRLEGQEDDTVSIADLANQPAWEVEVDLGELTVPRDPWTVDARACTDVEGRLEYLE